MKKWCSQTRCHRGDWLLCGLINKRKKCPYEKENQDVVIKGGRSERIIDFDDTVEFFYAWFCSM